MVKLMLIYFKAIMVGLANYLMPVKVAHAYHPGDPNMATFLNTMPIDNGCFATSPTTGYKNGVIMTCPRNANVDIELRSVIITAYQAAIDATDDITILLKTVSAAGVADATLNTALSIKSTAQGDKVSAEVWRGSKVLTPGMSLVYEITCTTPDTAGFGYALSTEGQVQAS